MYLRHLANDWYGFINTVKQREAQKFSKTIKPLSSDGGGEDSVGDDGELSADDDSNGGVSVDEDGRSDGNMSKVDVGCDGDMGDDDCDSSDGVDGDMVDVNGNGDMGDVDVVSGGNDDDDGENDDVDIGNDSDGDSIGTDDDDSGDDGVNIDIGTDGDDETYSDGNVDGDDHVDFSNDIVGGSCAANDGNIDNVVLCNITIPNLQQALTCLIRLRYAVERMSSKGLFPYPVTPLVKLMKYIETLYELGH